MLPEEPSTAYFQIKLPELLATLVTTSQSGNVTGDDDLSMLAEAFDQLENAMLSTDRFADTTASQSGTAELEAKDISQLGEYGLNLYSAALNQARQLRLDSVVSGLQELIVVFALWLARRDCTLYTLEQVVDALAQLANQLREPEQLKQLYKYIKEIQEAVAPAIRQDLEKNNPGRPWRVMNLNRAIVATRTHQPEIMEEAFEFFIRQLPEEAPGFFSQGMEQMDLLNYPDQVRQVMNKYFQQWKIKPFLH